MDKARIAASFVVQIMMFIISNFMTDPTRLLGWGDNAATIGQREQSQELLAPLHLQSLVLSVKLKSLINKQSFEI